MSQPNTNQHTGGASSDQDGTGGPPPEGTSPADDTGTGSGTETGADGGDGTDAGGDSGEPTPPTRLADVMATLDEASQRIVRAAVNKKNSENQNLRRRVEAAEPKARKWDENQESDKSAEDQAAERERAANERAEAATNRMVRSEIRALAAGRFADPEDASAFLGDVSTYLTGDGEPDTDAIEGALDDLLDRKPHLGKPAQNQNTPRPPAPNRAQGSSGGGSKPNRTTGTDLGREMFRGRRRTGAQAS